MSWLISTGFLAPFLVILILVVIVMFCVDGESNWERPKWFKYTYISLFVLLLCSFPFLALNLKEEKVYATEWKQIYQNDKDIDLSLAFDSDFDYKIPLNEPLANTQIYNSGDNSKVLNYTHYLTLKKDNASLTRKAKLTELVGETGSAAKVIKVEYRKIDYTYNRLFNFVGSHEKSEYDGELRLTFDNGEGAITRDDLSNFLEKGS
jgi:hypothetical protein